MTISLPTPEAADSAEAKNVITTNLVVETAEAETAEKMKA